MVKPVDWTQIKTEYITSDLSLREIAAKYEIYETRVNKHSADEGWVEARKEYRRKVGAKAIARAGARQANKLDKILQATEDTISTLAAALADPNQLHLHVVTETDAEGGMIVTERRFEKIDAKSLRDITGAIKELTVLLRGFYDIPTAAEAEQRQIALDKAAIERLKAEREAKQAEDGKIDTIRVVFDDGSPEAWNT